MSTPWVCLMYHDIAADAPTVGDGAARFAVPVDEYRRQLDQLSAMHFAGTSLGDALGSPQARMVAITFDDGTASQYEHGFRELIERGMTATFFVTTDWIGSPGYASWDQLREMRAGGMEVQAHTKSHPFLSELGPAELAIELRGAKVALDKQLEQDTKMLALPGGDWPRPSLQHLIGEVGYRVVATSRWGLNGPVTRDCRGLVGVRRCTVRARPGQEMFRRIATGDQWLRRRRGLRESFLGAMRTVAGPSRYAAWRRVFLRAFSL